MRTLTFTRAIVALLIAFLGVAGAFAQPTQMQRISLSLASSGYTRISDGFSGGLRQGGSRDHYVWLSAGRSYEIVGTCDNDCRDLDLRLIGPGGALVDEDRLADDVPQVGAFPQSSGWHRVVVEMAHCSRAPCFYEVGVHMR